MNPLAKTADASRQLLHDQRISADSPGTILRDVEALIDFIGEAGLVTKSKQGNLPSETLAELNTRLAAPIENYLKRPLLRNYPNIAGIYVLLRVMALARSEGKRLTIDCRVSLKTGILCAIKTGQGFEAGLENRRMEEDEGEGGF